MDIEHVKFYGSATVGEKGQIVLPSKLRHELEIKQGEKLAVLVIKRMAISGIVMVKSKDLISVVRKIFGEEFENLLETGETKTEETHEK